MNQEFVSLLAVDTPNYIVLSKLSNQQVKIPNEHLEDTKLDQSKDKEVQISTLIKHFWA